MNVKYRLKILSVLSFGLLLYIKRKCDNLLLIVYPVLITHIFQNLLNLNPKTKNHVNFLPSVQTKQNKQHWKRNIHEKCDVRRFN